MVAGPGSLPVRWPGFPRNLGAQREGDQPV
jgi:hypothetical protein